MLSTTMQHSLDVVCCVYSLHSLLRMLIIVSVEAQPQHPEHCAAPSKYSMHLGQVTTDKHILKEILLEVTGLTK